MYGQYSRAVSNQERVIVARVRQFLQAQQYKKLMDSLSLHKSLVYSFSRTRYKMIEISFILKIILSFLIHTLLYIKDKNLFVQQRGHNNFFTPDTKLAKIFGHKKNRLWTKFFYETYGITYPRNMDTMLKSDNIRGFVHESLLRSHLTPIYRHCDLKLIISFENPIILEQLIQRVF